MVRSLPGGSGRPRIFIPQEQYQPQPKGESQPVAIELLQQVLSLDPDHDYTGLNFAKAEHKLKPIEP
jgi:hypothetical protein